METQPMEVELDRPSANLPEDRRQAAQVAAAAREAAAKAKAKAKAAPQAAEEPQEGAAEEPKEGAAEEPQVRDLEAASVPVPPGFKGERKSYTVPAPDDCKDECGSIGVLWATNQLYVNSALNSEAFDRTFKINKKNGITISVRKLDNDWARAWTTAKQLAGWYDTKKKCFLSKLDIPLMFSLGPFTVQFCIMSSRLESFEFDFETHGVLIGILITRSYIWGI
ncbi:unnamed protein product [Symbiodinium sp. CCMP2592]|nr:unnamed protein product [Symbiodinium sp. CCMP2592]